LIKEVAPAVLEHPEARTTKGHASWPSPLSRTQRTNPPTKRRRLVAPAVARGSRGACLSRCTTSTSALGLAYGLGNGTASLALKPRGWFDARRVCNALHVGGAGVRRANGSVAAALGWLLQRFAVKLNHSSVSTLGFAQEIFSEVKHGLNGRGGSTTVQTAVSHSEQPRVSPIYRGTNLRARRWGWASPQSPTPHGDPRQRCTHRAHSRRAGSSPPGALSPE